MLAGAEIRKDTPDRTILEERILPYLASLPNVRRVLWVGCEYYTKWYESIFCDQAEYWTLEILPAHNRYGARKGRHVVDGMHNLSAHFADGSLDLILCNGVYGWGLDDPDDIEKAFAACHSALSPNGWLMIGWNDLPEHVPVPLSEIASLRDGFTPRIFPPLASESYAVPEVASRHNFSFYGPLPTRPLLDADASDAHLASAIDASILP